MRRRGRGLVARLAIAAASLFAVGVVGLFWFRVELVERLAKRELAALGLPHAAFRIESLGLAEARIGELRLAPEARADEVRLRYALFPPRLERVEIDGLFLDASRPSEGAFSLLRTDAGGGGAAPEVVLNGANVAADTPQGRLVVAFSGDYGPEGAAAGDFQLAALARGRFSLALSGPLAASDLRAEFTEVEVAGQQVERAVAEAILRLDGDVAALDGELAVSAPSPLGPAEARLPFAARIEPSRMTLRVEGGEAAAGGRDVAADGLSLSLTAAERVELRVSAREMRTGFLAPFAFEAGTADAAGGAFELTATGQGASLHGQGRRDPDAGDVELQLALAPIRFAPGRLQPGALAPALATLENVAGGFGADAILRWKEARFAGEGQLRFDDLSFDLSGVRVEGVGGAVRFVRLQPPATAPRQVLRARRLAAGAELENVRLAFRLDGAAKSLDVERFDADFAAGRLIVAGSRLKLGAPRNALGLQVDDVDLSALLALIGLEGLSGDGRVSGLLPLVLTPDDLLVEGGEIAATGRGAIRFRSPEAKQALAAGGEYVGLALEALEDFRYERLSLALDKPARGPAVARLSILGANPAVLDGHPFAINVTLNADANALLAQAMEAWRLSEGALATIVRGR